VKIPFEGIQPRKKRVHLFNGDMYAAQRMNRVVNLHDMNNGTPCTMVVENSELSRGPHLSLLLNICIIMGFCLITKELCMLWFWKGVCSTKEPFVAGATLSIGGVNILTSRSRQITMLNRFYLST